MALANSLQAQPPSFESAISMESFNHISRTGRMKAAARSHKGTEGDLIKADKKDEKLLDHKRLPLNKKDDYG
jgi:hypothetical protein